MSKINVTEWIRGSINKQMEISDIQKAIYLAIDSGILRILDTSIDLNYLFSEKLICAALEYKIKILEEAGVSDLVFYYYEFEQKYPDFILDFILNNYYDISKPDLNSLDIDEWDIVNVYVE